MYSDSMRTGTNLDLFTDSPWPPSCVLGRAQYVSVAVRPQISCTEVRKCRVYRRRSGSPTWRWFGYDSGAVQGDEPSTVDREGLDGRTPSSPELVSRTLMFFRGRKSFRLQFVRARSASSGVREAIDRILFSLKVEG